MLSTETPPDPSSSYTKLLSVKTDERAHEADPAVLKETAIPSFCIRDYVFASRIKGIPVNWPFMKDSLDYCLKHDIKDPLPPFEAPALVKVQCLGEKTGTDQLILGSEGEEIVACGDLLSTRDIGLSKGQAPRVRNYSCLQSEEVVLDCSDEDNNPPGNEGKSAVHPGLGRDLHSLVSILENSEPVDTAEKLCRRLEKKCKLPIKFGAISSSNRAEDIASNSSMVSDSMASKVCPVCKTFSSTSNTTLNAHIDQCLSTESNTDGVLSKFPKLNVKPRKKKMMVDIYTTASRYTLEDLDRRNGTNWATEVAFLAQPTTEVSSVTESTTSEFKSTIESKDDKREGSVYVDSKGIKVRILSNFNIPLPGKDLKLQRRKKDLKTGGNILIEKRKHSSLNHSMNMKLMGQKRKLSAFNLHVKQIPGGNEQANNGKSIDSLSKSWTDQNKARNSKSHLFCQPSCSPYPDSPRNPGIDFVERILPRCNKLAKCNPLDLSNSNSTRKHPKKLTRPPEDLTHSTGEQRADFPHSTVQPVVHGRGKATALPVSHSSTSVHALVLRSGNHTSFPRRKDDVPLCMSNDSSGMTVTPSENSESPIDGQRNSTLKTNESIRRSYSHLDKNETVASENLPIYNKFHKHKSHTRTARRRREFRAPYNVGVCGIPVNHGFDLEDKAKSLGSSQSGFSKCVEMSDARDIMNHMSPSQRDIQESNERENSNTMDEHSNIMDGEQNSSTRHPTRNERQMQVEIPDSRVHNIGDVIVNLNPKSASCMQMNPSSFMEGHHYTLSGNKTNMQVNQEDNIQYACHDAERGAETSVREVKDSWLEHLGKCHGDAVAVQQCASSLTSHGDLGIEMRSKNSLTTLVCQTATPDKSSASEHEHSSSPVSTASTVSLQSSGDPKSNEPELELLTNSVILHNKPCTAGPFTENYRGTQGSDIDGRILETKENFRGDEPGCIVNNKPFCCSCKESLSVESQLLRLKDITRTADAPQISNLFTGPRISSSFTDYQNMATTVASTALESHSVGVSQKKLVDSAVTYPVFMDVGLAAPSNPQSQPPSNSVLRLMGKNLTVANNEEFVQPQTSTSEYRPTMNYLSPAFVSTNNFLKQDNFPYHSGPTSASSSQAMSIGDAQMNQQYIIAASAGFVGFPYSNNWVRINGQQSQQKKPYQRLDSCSSPYVMNEVIMIDDSPERETGFRSLVSPTSTFNPVASSFNPLLQRPVAWLPSRSPNKEVPGVPTSIRFRTYSTG